MSDEELQAAINSNENDAEIIEYLNKERERRKKAEAGKVRPKATG